MFYETTIYLPTIWGWLAITLIVVILGSVYLRYIHLFLAINRPIKAEVLVVEGWLRDYALIQAAENYKLYGYQRILVTGGKLDRGEYLSEYGTFAALAKASLVKMGIPQDSIVTLPTPYTLKDRTYNSAFEVKHWFDDHPQYTKANIITVGVHSRRSYEVFRKVLPNSIELGVISVSYDEYEPETWWKTSIGVRWVISEQIAYIYYKIFG